MIAELLRQARGFAAGLHDIKHVASRDSLAGEPVCLVERLKEGSVCVLDARLLYIGIQELLRLPVQPDQFLLAAFLHQPQPRALSVQPVIAALYADNGAHPPDRVVP